MSRQCIRCNAAPRYIPYVLCRECLQAERESERRAFSRYMRSGRYSIANEHGQYIDTKAEGKEA